MEQNRALGKGSVHVHTHLDLDRLIPALRSDPDAGVRLGAALALKEWMTREIDTGRDFAALLDAHPTLLPALIDRLGDVNKGVQVTVAECLQFLAYHSAQVVPALRAALTGDAWRSWGAALVLGRMRLWAPEMAAAFTGALGAKDKDVRWACAGMCLQLGAKQPEAVRTIQAAMQHADGIVRKMAAYTLGEMGTYADVEATLRPGLQDPERDVRRATLLSLNKLAQLTPETLRQMAACKHDADIYVRRTATALTGKKTHVKTDS